MSDEPKTRIKIGVIFADLQAPRTREEALLECDRELGVRVRCFPDWHSQGKLAMVDGKQRLECMAEACRILSVVHSLSAEQWQQVEAQAELAKQQQT